MEKTQKSQKNTQKIEKTATIRGLVEELTPFSNWVSNAKQLFTGEGGNINLNTLYETVKRSPEVMACINAIVEDIMADGWRFVGSKFAIEKAKKFQYMSKFYKVLTNALLDLLITGDAYILKLAVEEEKIKSLFVSLTSKIAKDLKVKINKQEVFELLKQDVLKPRDLQVLKASTMQINYDETGTIKSYVQNVSGFRRVYKANDIIHLTVMNIGGSPYGFTPLEPLLSDVATLIFAKEFAGKYFENDGIPYFLFNLPEATPDDRQYELLKKELKELKNTSNKYRSLVTTGKITAEQINKFNKDMEFAKLIQHFTQIVLMAMGVPPHRVSFLDVRQSASELGKIEAGYYKKIAFMQKAIEEILNSELWVDFKVQMKFFKSYKIDEMREAQIAQIATQAGFMTIEEIRERMGLEPKLPNGTMGKPTGDDKAINFREDKKRERGQEENPEIPTDNKLKMLKSLDEIKINFHDFVKVVEFKVGAGRFDQANILYIETEDRFIMFFHDGNWKYKTELKKTEIDNIDAFRTEMLRNAIKIFI